MLTTAATPVVFGDWGACGVSLLQTNTQTLAKFESFVHVVFVLLF